MREIKLRGWDTKKKRMYSAEEMGRDQLTLSPDGRGFINVHGRDTKLSKYYTYIIPLQYTGDKDKNGVEIYHDDLYKARNSIVYRVEMKVDGWGLFSGNSKCGVPSLYWMNICEKTNGEVIGNIHQNPELLE